MCYRGRTTDSRRLYVVPEWHRDRRKVRERGVGAAESSQAKQSCELEPEGSCSNDNFFPFFRLWTHSFLWVFYAYRCFACHPSYFCTMSSVFSFDNWDSLLDSSSSVPAVFSSGAPTSGLASSATSLSVVTSTSPASLLWGTVSWYEKV